MQMRGNRLLAQCVAGEPSRYFALVTGIFKMQKVVGIILLVLTIGVLLFFAPICWVLRNGMGPDSTMSSGYHAVGRFLFLFVFPVVALSPVWGVALVLIKAGSEKPRQVQKPSAPKDSAWPPPPTKLPI